MSNTKKILVYYETEIARLQDVIKGLYDQLERKDDQIAAQSEMLSRCAEWNYFPAAFFADLVGYQGEGARTPRCQANTITTQEFRHSE